jgi:hypothetical protein
MDIESKRIKLEYNGYTLNQERDSGRLNMYRDMISTDIMAIMRDERDIENAFMLLGMLLKKRRSDLLTTKIEME